MKKKNLFKLMLLLMVSIFSISFVSCGDDKEDDPEPSKQTSLLVGSWHKDETYSHGVYWVEIDWILNADGTYSESSSFGQKKGQYFYNETLKTLTLSGTYISGDYKGESRTSSYTVLSLSETDLVLQFVAEEGLITSHFKRVK